LAGINQHADIFKALLSINVVWKLGLKNVQTVLITGDKTSTTCAKYLERNSRNKVMLKDLEKWIRTHFIYPS